MLNSEMLEKEYPSFRIVLIYHIELGKLLAIKKPIDAFHNENSKLMEREQKKTIQ